mmetsp:Transcript_90452/g.281613  ORF Transcript_90452/g.281613 Transcript_90452/m.281613 type:complete len:227 (-) Transcript_90452:44-724(-)
MRRVCVTDACARVKARDAERQPHHRRNHPQGRQPQCAQLPRHHAPDVRLPLEARRGRRGALGGPGGSLARRRLLPHGRVLRGGAKRARQHDGRTGHARPGGGTCRGGGAAAGARQSGAGWRRRRQAATLARGDGEERGARRRAAGGRGGARGVARRRGVELPGHRPRPRRGGGGSLRAGCRGQGCHGPRLDARGRGDRGPPVGLPRRPAAHAAPARAEASRGLGGG